MSKMGSHDPFEHLKHKLWPKERSGVKLAVWLPTTKSLESTWFPFVQVACDTPLESSWRGLQLCFRPHLNQMSIRNVMGPQSRKSPNFGNFEISTWESRDKKPFGCGSHEEAHSILKGGRWWLPPSPGRCEFRESKLLVVHPNTKSAPTMH
jgi:hypothetical protein